VLVGFDATGNPVVNDPAASIDEAVQRTYVRQPPTSPLNSTKTAARARWHSKAQAMYTLDASIWMREATSSDPAYATCHALLDALRTQALALYEPWLLLAEVGGPISRLLRDPIRGRLYADIVRSFPNTTFVSLTKHLPAKPPTSRRIASCVALTPSMPSSLCALAAR
jgi:predicted nucleic acid-binding protein